MFRQVLASVVLAVFAATQASAVIPVGGLCSGIAGPLPDTSLAAVLDPIGPTVRPLSKANAQTYTSRKEDFAPVSLDLALTPVRLAPNAAISVRTTLSASPAAAR
ncbi:hypothetical protein BKA70DRAFT_1416051 [Coprinopsis sp. MPI-PUGE-AT-0042]|nr:hypothetical protein BKA70DRAFT_1416051 [Coprinopsis sp. MPI-PUGE-AT-0042]